MYPFYLLVLRHDFDTIRKLAKQNLEPVQYETGQQIAWNYEQKSIWSVQHGLKRA